jgi:hypothetical protein
MAALQSRVKATVGISARSAKRGTIRLPAVMPVPNTASTNGTVDGETCVTSSRVEAT